MGDVCSALVSGTEQAQPRNQDGNGPSLQAAFADINIDKSWCVYYWTARGMRGGMLDHVSLGVSDLERSRRFYDAVLRPLGIVRIVDFQQRGSDYGAMAGSLGVEFTITIESVNSLLSRGMHVCFRAPNRESVREFHAAALRCGGQSDGEPGLRPRYHADYFAAFVLDPDGHRVEAVCHAPPAPATV